MDSFIVSGGLMKRGGIIFCWICVIVTAGFLRFDELGKRPMHADEARGASIAARRMNEGGVRFDPTHYHGPLLGDLALPVCRLRGETGWREMTKTTLRIVPALAGVLLVGLPLLWRRRCGDGRCWRLRPFWRPRRCWSITAGCSFMSRCWCFSGWRRWFPWSENRGGRFRES